MRLPHHSFWNMCFFMCDYGLNEEKDKRTLERRILLGRGVDVREGRMKRRKRGADGSADCKNATCT